MIQSMTGFGRATLELPDKKITVEIRSLNSKSLDLNIRLPYLYKEKESELRKIVSESLGRGKIDLHINTEAKTVSKAQEINSQVITAYIDEFKKIVPTASEAELLQVVMRLPDVITYATLEVSEEEWNGVLSAVNEAIKELNKYRSDEGLILFADFELRIKIILDLLDEIPKYENERIETIKERLLPNLEELNTGVDQNRFEQEMIYFLEKLDITEEKTRLKNNCEYFLENLSSDESNGKKLGFITQEIGREINTIGSKSNHHEMQKIVVEMKDELEKIKEQILNIC